jgi:hypothetical protein
MMESIDAAGGFSPPMIIMPGVHIKQKHIENDLEDETTFAVSKSGYTNDVLSFE